MNFRGANTHEKAEDGSIALHLASNSGVKRIVQMLAGNSYTINMADAQSWTALHMAASRGYQVSISPTYWHKHVAYGRKDMILLYQKLY